MDRKFKNEQVMFKDYTPKIVTHALSVKLNNISERNAFITTNNMVSYNRI